MKISKVLKVLGAAAAIAALTPYQVEKDEKTGATTLKALLWGVKYTPAAGETGRNVDVTLGLNLPGQKDESGLFADDEPEAAVVDADEPQVIADEAQKAADEAQAIADEAQEAADEAQAIADEAQEAADEAQAIAGAAQDAAEATFDPEF